MEQVYFLLFSFDAEYLKLCTEVIFVIFCVASDWLNECKQSWRAELSSCQTHFVFLFHQFFLFQKQKVCRVLDLRYWNNTQNVYKEQ